MKRLFPFAWTAIFWAACSVSGTEVTSQTAAQVAKVWLAQSRPLGVPLSKRTTPAITRKGFGGSSLYHVINLQPEGFVVVAGDDATEPVVAFSATGHWNLNTGGPLTAMLDRDMMLRQAVAKFQPAAAELKARWQALSAPLPSSGSVMAGVASITDVRVAPLLSSKWSQTANFAGVACFNYFVPPYGDGNKNNYPCGCVATAMAQVMRYFQYPTNGVGTGSYQIYVDGAPQSKNLRGGNGSGGAYRWDLMPLVSNTTDTNQTSAIGALLYDAGLSVHMSYAASGSGATGFGACSALGSVFKFKNAINTSRYNGSLGGTNVYTVINPNLDAGLPVMMSISGTTGGHEVVCDGYGYVNTTMYHHVNLGWQGTADAWYTLPGITGSGYSFTVLDDCTYNIFTNTTGEIISGRVLDVAGSPVSGATVTATPTSGSTVTTTTSAQGIYALIGVVSGTTYTITVSPTGYGTRTASVKTGTSQSTSCGNIWGCNFTVAPEGVAIVKPSLVTQPVGATNIAGRSLTLSVVANGDYLVYQWSKDGVKITGANSTNYTVASTAASDSGTYTVTVANSLGTVTSKGASVLVIAPPTITAQPGDQYVKIGSSCSLSVTATGAALTYRWLHSGTNIACSSAKYTISKAQTNDSGTYVIIITNVAGSITSNPARLTVLNPPSITAAPSAQSCPQGSNITLSVTASGDQLAYQWKKGSTAISGATASSYTITRAQKADAGSYSVVVSNAVGTITASVNLAVVAPPTVSASAATVTLLPGLTTTLKGTATGTGTLGYQWSFNGTPISGATTNVYTITNADHSDVGTYVLTVTNFGGSAQASIVAGWSADTTAPTVRLDGTLGTVTNATLKISGKASDNVAVSNVSYSVNGGSWTLATTTNKWTNWSAQVTLDKQGTNLLLITVSDVNSNSPVPLTNRPVYAPVYTVTVNVTGAGKVTANWKGNQVQYGKTYTATAVNGPAYVLKNWTGDIPTNQATLTFMAASNMTVAANFVPNLFTNSGGSYNGLFIGTNSATHTNTGFWSGSINTNLTYSSKVLLEGDTVAFSGKFDTDGKLVQSVTRKGKSPLQLNLALDFTNHQLTGTISADTWGSYLIADLAAYSKTNTTTNAGNFTFVFPSNPGYGGGQVNVSTNGIITFVGNAPDGTSLSQSVPISSDGYWPLFVPLYTKGTTNFGEVYGWLNFTNGKPNGKVTWYRPAGLSPYSSGFQQTNAVENSVFSTPSKSAPKALGFYYGQINFTGGGLSAPFSELFLMADDGTLYTQGASQLKINAKGQISGSVTDPLSGVKANLMGTVLQTPKTAKGSVLWTNQLGEFTITPVH